MNVMCALMYAPNAANGRSNPFSMSLTKLICALRSDVWGRGGSRDKAIGGVERPDGLLAVDWLRVWIRKSFIVACGPWDRDPG